MLCSGIADFIPEGGRIDPTSRVWARLVWRLPAAVGALLLWVGSGHAQPSDKRPPPAGQSIEALLEAKARRTPAQRKLSSRLLDAAQPSDGGARRQAPTAGVKDELVTVDIRADVTPAVLARIRALGGTLLNSVPKYRAIRARLPLSSLEPLATLDAVQSIRPADQAQTRGSCPTD